MILLKDGKHRCEQNQGNTCEKKKTAKWLAGELGKAPATVSKWCMEELIPTLQTIQAQ